MLRRPRSCSWSNPWSRDPAAPNASLAAATAATASTGFRLWVIDDDPPALTSTSATSSWASSFTSVPTFPDALAPPARAATTSQRGRRSECQGRVGMSSPSSPARSSTTCRLPAPSGWRFPAGPPNCTTKATRSTAAAASARLASHPAAFNPKVVGESLLEEGPGHHLGVAVPLGQLRAWRERRPGGRLPPPKPPAGGGASRRCRPRPGMSPHDAPARRLRLPTRPGAVPVAARPGVTDSVASASTSVGSKTRRAQASVISSATDGSRSPARERARAWAASKSSIRRNQASGSMRGATSGATNMGPPQPITLHPGGLPRYGPSDL
ncbi:MAG: hypothetical protein KatS3mg011_1728 [Acidimicrobiia bacterium]|nr:MAG: hypothetical protein KatS3mg011_1728 [Acidimicrobiia bacterium]